MPAAAASLVIAGVASVSTGLTMIASTPWAMKFWIWLSCLQTSFCASSTCRFTPSMLRGVVLHAVAQHGQEIVVEQRHGHADVGGIGHGWKSQHHGRGAGETQSAMHGSKPPVLAPERSPGRGDARQAMVAARARKAKLSRMAPAGSASAWTVGENGSSENGPA